MKRMFCLGMLLLATATTAAAQRPEYREGHITTADSARLYYRIYGEKGDTIVYLHGGPGGSIEGQLEFLAPLARNHVLIGYDQRGAGLSGSVDSTRLTVADHIADLEAIRAHLRIPAMTLYGHSWGSALAVLYADKHPQHVKRLVINGPMPPAFEPYNAQRWAGIEAAIAKLCTARSAALPDADRAAAIDKCKKQPNMNARVYYHDTMNIARFSRQRRGLSPLDTERMGMVGRATLSSLGKWDYRPILSRIRVPALVVEGAHTPIPIDQIEVWAKTLGNGRLLLVPKTAHAYPHNENPDYFFPAIETFLAGKWPKDAR